jgi:hypothetical protein
MNPTRLAPASAKSCWTTGTRTTPRALARGTYDGYIDPLLDLIRSGAGEDAVVEWLHERERESMCFPALGTARLRRVARRLITTASARPE